MKIVESILAKNSWGNLLGLSRSLMALGTSLTLLFNSSHELLINGEPSRDPFGISIFFILKQHIAIATLLSLVILIFTIIGWRPRITSIFHWWITYSFSNSFSSIDGGDHINTILTALLLPVCLTDSRKWHWDSIERMPLYRMSLSLSVRSIIAQVSFLVIKIQISFIYLHSAVAKVAVEEWMNGTALYYWFTHPVFGANEYISTLLSFLIYNDFLLTYLTWLVILFEFCLFAGIFMDTKLKKYFLGLGLLFHFLIFLIHGLFTFFLIMAGVLILYFTPNDNSESITRLKKLLASKRIHR